MVNNVVLTGRLTKAPQLSKTNSGKSVLKFSLAVDRGGRDDGADFLNCIAWEKTAELIAQYCPKGSLIAVEGRLQTGSYDDQNTGRKVYTTDVVVNHVSFLDTRSENTAELPPEPQNERVSKFRVTADELPF